MQEPFTLIRSKSDATGPLPRTRPDLHGDRVVQLDEVIGTIAWQAHIPLFELAVQSASLEEAFMKLTGDSVEYRSTQTADVAVAA